MAAWGDVFGTANPSTPYSGWGNRGLEVGFGAGFGGLLGKINPTVDATPDTPLVHEPTEAEIEVARRRELLSSGYRNLSWRGPYDEPEPEPEEQLSGWQRFQQGFLGAVNREDTSATAQWMINQAVNPGDPSKESYSYSHFAGAAPGDLMVINQNIGEGDTQRQVVARPGTRAYRDQQQRQRRQEQAR